MEFKQMSSLLNMNLNNSELKQAEHFWKMLDEMADSNQEEYKKFIDKNIKEGIKEIETQNKQEIEKNKIKPCIGFCLQMNAQLNIINENSEDQKSYEFFQQQIQKNKLDNLPKQIKLYTNICYSEKVLNILDKQNQIITELTSSSQWNIIPFSIQNPKIYCNSDKNYIGIFDIIINDDLYHFCNQNLKELNILTYHLIEQLQKRLKYDKNLIAFINKEQSVTKQNFQYYEICKNSIKQLKNKPYKFSSKQKQLEEIILEEISQKLNYKKFYNQSQSKPNQILTSNDIFNEQKKEISIDTNENKTEQNKIQLIQEIEEKQQKNVNIKQIEQQVQPHYTLKYDKNVLNIEIDLEKVALFKQIDLQISDYQLKLIHPYYKLAIDFNSEYNSSKVEAKWDKKSKKLKIKLLQNL